MQKSFILKFRLEDHSSEELAKNIESISVVHPSHTLGAYIVPKSFTSKHLELHVSILHKHMHFTVTDDNDTISRQAHVYNFLASLHNCVFVHRIISETLQINIIPEDLPTELIHYVKSILNP